MKRVLPAVAIIGALMVAGVSDNFAGDAKKKVEPKCPVKGKAVKTSISIKWNGGKVYFC